MRKKRLPFSSQIVNLGEINKTFMKSRVLLILLCGSFLLVSCGGTKGEGSVGDVTVVRGKLPDDTESVDLALDILLDRREQIMVVKEEFGTTRGLLSMEDIIETLLGVEIVDEADLDAIEEGTTAEDLREFAKEKFGHTNDENEQQNGE